MSTTACPSASTEDLVRENRQLIFYCLNRIRGRCYIPEDELVAAGLVALWRAAIAYDPQRGPFSTLACRCIWRALWNALTMARRRAKRLPRALAIEAGRLPSPPGYGPCERAAAAENAAVAERLLLALPAQEKHVVRRMYYDGATAAEVGAEIGCSKERVRYIHQSALARLRRHAKAGRLAPPF